MYLISNFRAKYLKRVLFTTSGQMNGKKDHHYYQEGMVIAVASFNQMTEHQMLSSSLEEVKIKD